MKAKGLHFPNSVFQQKTLFFVYHSQTCFKAVTNTLEKNSRLKILAVPLGEELPQNFTCANSPWIFLCAKNSFVYSTAFPGLLSLPTWKYSLALYILFLCPWEMQGWRGGSQGAVPLTGDSFFRDTFCPNANSSWAAQFALILQQCVSFTAMCI